MSLVCDLVSIRLMLVISGSFLSGRGNYHHHSPDSVDCLVFVVCIIINSRQAECGSVTTGSLLWCIEELPEQSPALPGVGVDTAV